MIRYAFKLSSSIIHDIHYAIEVCQNYPNVGKPQLVTPFVENINVHYLNCISDKIILNNLLILAAGFKDLRLMKQCIERGATDIENAIVAASLRLHESHVSYLENLNIKQNSHKDEQVKIYFQMMRDHKNRSTEDFINYYACAQIKCKIEEHSTPSRSGSVCICDVF